VERPIQGTPMTRRSYWNNINSEDDETLDQTAGHWFSWRPRSYIPARSSTSCYTLCKPFSQPSVYWRLDSKRASSRLQKEHMTKLLKISLILQTILTTNNVVYTWFATRNCKNINTGQVVVSTLFDRKFADSAIFIYWRNFRCAKSRMEYRSFDKFFIMYNICVLYNCMYE